MPLSLFGRGADAAVGVRRRNVVIELEAVPTVALRPWIAVNESDRNAVR